MRATRVESQSVSWLLRAGRLATVSPGETFGAPTLSSVFVKRKRRNVREVSLAPSEYSTFVNQSRVGSAERRSMKGSRGTLIDRDWPKCNPMLTRLPVNKLVINSPRSIWLEVVRETIYQLVVESRRLYPRCIMPQLFDAEQQLRDDLRRSRYGPDGSQTWRVRRSRREQTRGV